MSGEFLDAVLDRTDTLLAEAKVPASVDGRELSLDERVGRLKVDLERLTRERAELVSDLVVADRQAADLRRDLDDARAKLRREQDARADLRRELDRVKAELAQVRLRLDVQPDPEEFAVWLVSRGWLADVAGGSVALADRLAGAARFKTEDEARAALEEVERLDGCSYAYLSECGSVVSL